MAAYFPRRQIHPFEVPFGRYGALVSLDRSADAEQQRE